MARVSACIVVRRAEPHPPPTVEVVVPSCISTTPPCRLLPVGAVPTWLLGPFCSISTPFIPLTPNPPKDTDGRREESGRGGEGATGEIAWVPFGVGRSADGLHRRTGAPMAVCGSCDARDGERIRSRELSRTGLARVCGDLRLSGGWVADGAVRPGVEWLAAGPRRG